VNSGQAAPKVSKLLIKRKMESDVPTLKPEVQSRLSRHLRCLKRWTTSGQQKLPCSCKYSFSASMSSRSKRKARPKNRAMVVLLECRYGDLYASANAAMESLA
jgi:hypothetical protein